MNVKDVIKSIIIARSSGEFLVDLILDSDINSMLLSGFVGALSLFGKENLGNITNISISGLEIDMLIAYQYDLILIAILTKGYATYGLREQAEKAMEMFYTTYLSEMTSKECVNLEEYATFREILLLELWKYIQDIEAMDEDDKKSREFQLISADEEEGKVLEKLNDIPFPSGELDEAFISKYFKGIILCDQKGEYLVDIILDSNINLSMLSSFIGALSMFGKDSLGKIEELNIMGLDIEIVMVAKYDLILITIIDKSFVKFNLREEIEMTLDMFYSSFQEEIHQGADKSTYFEFKNMLYWQVVDYFKKLRTRKEEKERQDMPDYGFFSDAIFKLKKDTQNS